MSTAEERSMSAPVCQVHRLVVELLTKVVSEGSSKKIAGREVKLRAALYSITGESIVLVESNRSSREAYQIAAYLAVDRKESDDSDQQLTDQLVMLEERASFVSDQLADPNLPPKSAQKALLDDSKRSTSEEIKGLRTEIGRRGSDVAFLAARAMSDALETSRWGAGYDEVPADGELPEATKTTLRAAMKGMSAIVQAINSKRGPATPSMPDPGSDEEAERKDQEEQEEQREQEEGQEDPEEVGDQDEHEEEQDPDSDSSRDTRKGKKRPNWTNEEDLELLNIWNSNPAAKLREKAAMHNAAMAAKIPNWRDRTMNAIAKHFRQNLQSSE